MARRRTRLPPRFAVGATAPTEREGFDVPANLGTTPGRPPRVSDYLERHPGGVLQVDPSPRASWPAAVIALGLPALIAFAFSRGRR